MQTIQELGQAVAQLRSTRRLKQVDVAQRAGISAESLFRFERGLSPEFGTRKWKSGTAFEGFSAPPKIGRSPLLGKR